MLAAVWSYRSCCSYHVTSEDESLPKHAHGTWDVLTDDRTIWSHQNHSCVEWRGPRLDWQLGWLDGDTILSQWADCQRISRLGSFFWAPPTYNGKRRLSGHHVDRVTKERKRGKKSLSITCFWILEGRIGYAYHDDGSCFGIREINAFRYFATSNSKKQGPFTRRLGTILVQELVFS